MTKTHQELSRHGAGNKKYKIIMDILVIKQEFGSLILSGKKTWEFRRTVTKKRGIIAIAYSGTK